MFTHNSHPQGHKPRQASLKKKKKSHNRLQANYIRATVQCSQAPPSIKASWLENRRKRMPASGRNRSVAVNVPVLRTLAPALVHHRKSTRRGSAEAGPAGAWQCRGAVAQHVGAFASWVEPWNVRERRHALKRQAGGECRRCLPVRRQESSPVSTRTSHISILLLRAAPELLCASASCQLFRAHILYPSSGGI